MGFAELANPDLGNALASQAIRAGGTTRPNQISVTISAMRPSNRRRVLFQVIDRITALFGGTRPLHWLSVVGQESGGLLSFTVTLHEVDEVTPA